LIDDSHHLLNRAISIIFGTNTTIEIGATPLALLGTVGEERGWCGLETN
jgi:hypothetical protein